MDGLMCRLFALSAEQPVTARFWLLDAPYSLRAQSRFNADGTGIGWIDEEGVATVAKRPVAAFDSERFERTAMELTARTTVAHIRLSSGTTSERENTHPFLMDGIVIAHNGVLHVTDALRERVSELGAAEHVHGTTDSEWMAALIAGETALREREGAPRVEALHAGLIAAITWIARNVPVYSVNLLVARDHHLFALRLPAMNELWVLDRPAGAVVHAPLEQESDTLRAESEDLRDVHSVVVASEPMDDDEGWRLLDDGELLHIAPDGTVTSEHPFPALAQPLQLEDLGLSAAASQAHAAQAHEHAARRAGRDAARRPAVAVG